jgi:hypothetical protein
MHCQNQQYRNEISQLLMWLGESGCRDTPVGWGLSLQAEACTNGA